MNFERKKRRDGRMFCVVRMSEDERDNLKKNLAIVLERIETQGENPSAYIPSFDWIVEFLERSQHNKKYDKEGEISGFVDDDDIIFQVSSVFTLITMLGTFEDYTDKYAKLGKDYCEEVNKHIVLAKQYQELMLLYKATQDGKSTNVIKIDKKVRDGYLQMINNIFAKIPSSEIKYFEWIKRALENWKEGEIDISLDADVIYYTIIEFIFALDASLHYEEEGWEKMSKVNSNRFDFYSQILQEDIRYKDELEEGLIIAEANHHERMKAILSKFNKFNCELFPNKTDNNEIVDEVDTSNKNEDNE